MSYRQQQRGGRGGYEPDPWQSNNGWGGGQMWQSGYGHQQGGYGGGGHHHQQQPAQQHGYQNNHYQQHRSQAPAPRHLGYHQQAPPRGYGRPPVQQQAHQGGHRGLKRPAQHFNNNNGGAGVSVVKRLRGARGTGGRPVQQKTNKKPDAAKEDAEGFCKICQEKFDGTYNQHKLTKPHREKRAQKYPSCGPCGLKFNGDDARQRFEVHLGSKAHMQVVETAELDIKEGQEPEGTELCEPIEAVMCTLCECVFKKELVDTHCKTKGHLKRITKKKAEADRAAKKAEGGQEGGENAEGQEGDEAHDDEGQEAEDDADDDNGEGGEQEEEGGEEEGGEEEEGGDGEEGEGGHEGEEEAAAEEDAPAAEEEAAAPAEEEPQPVEEAEPEPAKTSPAKKTPARRGRGRGRK